MSFSLRVIVSLVVMLGLSGRAVADTEAFQAPVADTWREAVRESAGVACRGCGWLGMERRPVLGDIAEYTLRLKVGEGAYDVVTLHRVVREAAPWRPVSAPESIFLVHGDGWGFRGAYMSSTETDTVAADQSLALFLAGKGVDVWGLDMRWVHVPLETQDFTFMKDWNLGTHVGDVGTGLAVARAVRRATGSGFGKLNLLGWSRGALLAYAYASQETQRPEGLRHVGGLIPMDMVLEFGPEAEPQREWACARHDALLKQLQAGRYEGGLLGPGAGIGLHVIGELALAAPGEPSPLVPPPPDGESVHVITNREMALTAGAATFALFPSPLTPAVPGYHLTAGQFGADGLSQGLRFTREEYFFDQLRRAVPYQSFTEVVETESLMCGEEALPYATHLADVKVPVLYVGAAGGFGDYGVHTLSLLGSRDVTVHIVRTQPPEGRVLDFGHADLLLARTARDTVWAPILTWMRHH